MRSSKTKSNQLLRIVGLWATIWWAVSGLYLVLVVWLAKDYYVQAENNVAHSWTEAMRQAYAQEFILTWLLIFILIIWILGCVAWLVALKKAGISIGAGLKDLFLTLR